MILRFYFISTGTMWKVTTLLCAVAAVAIAQGKERQKAKTSFLKIMKEEVHFLLAPGKTK